MNETTTPADTDEMCEYCLDNPAEPNLPCCDNSRCKGYYFSEGR